MKKQIVKPVLKYDESVAGVKEKYLGAEEKSKQLAALYQQVASKYNCAFVDIAKFVSPSKTDGYHLEPKDHQVIADRFYNLVSNLNL